MFVFAITLIAGLGSILSEHGAKIVSGLKAEFKFSSVVARFAKFFPKSKTKSHGAPPTSVHCTKEGLANFQRLLYKKE
jgi:hypothetical protein